MEDARETRSDVLRRQSDCKHRSSGAFFVTPWGRRGLNFAAGLQSFRPES
jgi:hypothetical protein